MFLNFKFMIDLPIFGHDQSIRIWVFLINQYISLNFRTTTSKMAAREETESEFFAKLNFPWFIRFNNNNRFEVVEKLECMREKIRNIEIAIAKEIKEKEEIERYDLGLCYILDY